MCAERRQVAFNDSPEDILDSSYVLDQNVEGSLYDRLMDCLKADNVEKVKEIIQSLKSCDNFTLLHFAAKAGACKVLQFCLDTTSCNVNCRDGTSEENTALYWAIKEGHQDAVHLLLDSGASSDALNLFDDDAVYVAVDFGHFEILQDLLARGLNADGPSRSMEDVVSPDTKKGITSLCRAIMQDDNRMVSALIAAGANIYKQCLVLTGTRVGSYLTNKDKATTRKILQCKSMHIAVNCCSSTQIVSTLLEAGFDLNSDFTETDNPIILAARQRHYEQVRVMLSHCKRSDVHASVLRIAVNLGQLNIAKEVLNYQLVDLNAQRSGQHHTPSYVHTAAKNCFIDVMRCLIARGADPCLDLSPYHIAYWLPFGLYTQARKAGKYLQQMHIKYSQILSVLLESTGGREINKASTESGTTAFYITCSRGNICMSLQLMRSGADVHKANFAAISPLHHLISDVVKPFTTNCDSKYRLIVMLLLFIVDFQPEFPWLANLLSDVITFPKLIKPIQSLIKIRLSNPSSLLELTRAAIYKYLNNNAHLKLNDLLVHLPSSLKPFLDLEDLIQAQVNLIGPGNNDSFISYMNCVCNPSKCLKYRNAVV